MARVISGSSASMRFVVSALALSVYDILGSVVRLPIVKRLLSAPAPEPWVRREQGCKLLAIKRAGRDLIGANQTSSSTNRCLAHTGTPLLEKKTVNQIAIYSKVYAYALI